ncbi:unnamed protein product [Colias eurytheme]|nr:unnamed protein product [Colias eurytheme]
MTFGAWNVRTLLDSDVNLCPERKTAVVARELSRYKVDIAALSETHLADEGELVEQGGGYKFFWKGTPSTEPRRSGVGFAIKTHIAKRLEEYPVYISDRIISLRLHLNNNNFLNIICVYAPTLDKDEETKGKFYDELAQTLAKIRLREKVLLMGDFNARVGCDHEAWPKVLGKHGIGNMNSNGQLLLSLCTQFNLAITNTHFQLPNKYKTTWMHPRSRHWHLIDYTIVRQVDMSQVLITRVMRGANCWSDHRLIITKLRLRMRYPRRSGRVKPKGINVDKLWDPDVRQQYVNILKDDIQSEDDGDLLSSWTKFSSRLITTAERALGLIKRRNEDWFDENDAILSEAFCRHRTLLRQFDHNRHRNNHLLEKIKKSGSDLRKLTRDTKDNWWCRKAEYLQWLSSTHQLGEFYAELKKLIGKTPRSSVPLRSQDGTQLLVAKEEILRRWAQYFNELLNTDRALNLQYINSLPSLPQVHKLDEPPTLQEVTRAISGQSNKKAVGVDNIPGELIKYGGEETHTAMWKLFVRMWDEELLPPDFKVSRICTLYKNKGSRSDCNSYRGVSLLSVPVALVPTL